MLVARRRVRRPRSKRGLLRSSCQRRVPRHRVPAPRVVRPPTRRRLSRLSEREASPGCHPASAARRQRIHNQRRANMARRLRGPWHFPIRVRRSRPARRPRQHGRRHTSAAESVVLREKSLLLRTMQSMACLLRLQMRPASNPRTRWRPVDVRKHTAASTHGRHHTTKGNAGR